MQDNPTDCQENIGDMVKGERRLREQYEQDRMESTDGGSTSVVQVLLNLLSSILVSVCTPISKPQTGEVSDVFVSDDAVEPSIDVNGETYIMPVERPDNLADSRSRLHHLVAYNDVPITRIADLRGETYPVVVSGEDIEFAEIITGKPLARIFNYVVWSRSVRWGLQVLSVSVLTFFAYVETVESLQELALELSPLFVFLFSPVGVGVCTLLILYVQMVMMAVEFSKNGVENLSMKA